MVHSSITNNKIVVKEEALNELNEAEHFAAASEVKKYRLTWILDPGNHSESKYKILGGEIEKQAIIQSVRYLGCSYPGFSYCTFLSPYRLL
jgi:hypothetical protein